jgi:Ser/Thr protein kinase RdoA (MazF antagonist)
MFPVQSSVLERKAICNVVSKAYALSLPISCSYFKNGTNDTYRVIADDATYYLRSYRAGWRKKDEIEAELTYLCELKKAGIPVSIPIEHSEGSYLIALDAPEGERFLSLFSNAAGDTLTPDNEKICSKLGELVGRLHLASDEVDKRFKRPQIDSSHLVTKPFNYINSFLKDESISRYARCIEKTLVEFIDNLPRNAPCYGMCHGDLHFINAHVDEQAEITLFDFDFCGYGWRSYDISIFLWSLQSDEFAETKQMSWQAFLNGYSSVRKLEDYELTAIPYFLIARQVWLMGLHASGTNIWGEYWLNGKYFKSKFDYIKRTAEEYGLEALKSI